MLCVQVPAKMYSHLAIVDYASAETLQNALYHKYNIEVSSHSVVQNSAKRLMLRFCPLNGRSGLQFGV